MKFFDRFRGKLSESDARFGVAPISDVPKIKHRQFSTFPCNKKLGLKLDDTFFFSEKNWTTTILKNSGRQLPKKV